MISDSASLSRPGSCPWTSTTPNARSDLRRASPDPRPCGDYGGHRRPAPGTRRPAPRETSIRAHLFHGTNDEAYLVGVSSNTAHGKPLSLAERLRASRVGSSSLRPDFLRFAAVAGICGYRPQRSGRAGPILQAISRSGRRGRPNTTAALGARLQAAELMAAFPKDSNRSIARSVGPSQKGTVRDVRRQDELGRGILASNTRPDRPVGPRILMGRLTRELERGERGLRLALRELAGRPFCPGERPGPISPGTKYRSPTARSSSSTPAPSRTVGGLSLLS